MTSDSDKARDYLYWRARADRLEDALECIGHFRLPSEISPSEFARDILRELPDWHPGWSRATGTQNEEGTSDDA
jgi:hypothetical protein